VVRIPEIIGKWIKEATVVFADNSHTDLSLEFSDGTYYTLVGELYS